MKYAVGGMAAFIVVGIGLFAFEEHGEASTKGPDVIVVNPSKLVDATSLAKECGTG